MRQIPMRSDGQITGAIDLISERAWQYQPGAASSLVELPREMVARPSRPARDAEGRERIANNRAGQGSSPVCC
ncbi:hypothetical protein Q4543_01475 [Salipiger sp. 1_MG-2023]|nr:hypothetical protein [Salipiger sp. 1_MG-2023]